MYNLCRLEAIILMLLSLYPFFYIFFLFSLGFLGVELEVSFAGSFSFLFVLC